eukprot:XP_024462657.1 uncharacterized protein LOC112328422 [Populus trichocarpa]
MEVDEDKENVRPVVKARVGLFGVKDKVESKGSQFRQIPLSEIDISSFQRPDLNSDGLFYPNLLTAFEKAAKEHMGVSEEERRESIDGGDLERIREAETQARTQQENLEKSREAERNLEDKEEEPPLKARRIEDDDDTGDPILGFPEKYSLAHHVKDVLVLGLFSVSIAVAAIRLSPKMGCQIYARIVMRMV